MGLFSSDSYPCTVCGSEVTDDPSNGRCDCGAAFHGECLKRIGNVKKEGHLIRSDKIKAKCPNCGRVDKW
jgi:rubrerythrin